MNDKPEEEKTGRERKGDAKGLGGCCRFPTKKMNIKSDSKTFFPRFFILSYALQKS